MYEEIKEFVEFRTDEDGTYFYYNDKDNVEQWSYKLDDLKDYIINLQQENARLKEKNKKAIDKLEFYNSGEDLWHVPIQEIIDILKEN